MRQIKYAQAIAEALDEILGEDERVTLIGAGFVGLTPSGVFLNPVREKYASRIKYPPIAELAYCGIGIGAAMAGLRPIIELSTATFSYEAIPQIVNEAAIACSNSAGQTSVPIVFHMLYGIRGAGAVQHSGSPQAWYWNTPGLQVAMPGTPADVKGLMRWAALKSRNPTVFLNHQKLMETEGDVPEGPYDVEFGQADVAREGSDVTIVATSIQVPRSLQAAETLAREAGISAEVVNVRTLQPLDKATILASVRKTGRVVVTDESHDNCGVAAGLAAIIADEGYDLLKAPIRRVSIPPVPIPYASSMEEFVTPSPERIVATVRQLVGGR
ncbi:MAG TPA: transketolase C-terminal domain-containing protein [Chloroflexota bacterium]|nr:transketolase C-terminal domain-containing protein [Chloroflexota bacterium]